MTQFGMYSQMTPRNDSSPSRGLRPVVAPSAVAGFAPDLCKTENRITLALLVRL